MSAMCGNNSSIMRSAALAAKADVMLMPWSVVSERARSDPWTVDTAGGRQIFRAHHADPPCTSLESSTWQIVHMLSYGWWGSGVPPLFARFPRVKSLVIPRSSGQVNKVIPRASKKTATYIGRSIYDTSLEGQQIMIMARTPLTRKMRFLNDHFICNDKAICSNILH